jgi:DNA-binding LytR/AlgR family response regulator
VKAYRLVIVEDNPDDQQRLLDYVARLPELTVAGVFADPVPAQEQLNTTSADLLLLDIDLPALSGFDLLRLLTDPPVVILTTLSISRSLEAYDAGVIDYLVKPFSFERFRRAIDRAGVHLAAPPPLMLKVGRQLVRVAPDTIRYVEADGSFCRVYLADRNVLVSQLLTDLVSQLSDSQFIRVHRSYLVAVSAIASVSSRYVVLQTREQLPIGDVYRAALRQRLGLP